MKFITSSQYIIGRLIIMKYREFCRRNEMQKNMGIPVVRILHIVKDMCEVEIITRGGMKKVRMAIPSLINAVVIECKVYLSNPSLIKNWKGWS